MVDKKEDNVVNIDGRRSEDARLLRIETMVIDLNAKVNNGLSSRSKETVQTLRSLDERQDAFEKVFLDHTVDDLEMKHDISLIKEALEDVVETQKSWIKLGKQLIVIVGGALVTLIGWMVINIETIASVVNHIFPD